MLICSGPIGDIMLKQPITRIRDKNRIINNIINVMSEHKTFLVLGHTSPDEDCVSSMVAIALLLNRFDKAVTINIAKKTHDNVSYLLRICKFNAIKIVHNPSKLPRTPDTVIICDTAKRSMLERSKAIDKLLADPKIIKIEIDHHIAGDSEHLGDPDYALVTAASSASELVGLIGLKLKGRRDVLSRFMVLDPLSRNFVLAVITGIIGDTQKGRYLKSRREKRYYDIFTCMFEDILMKSTVRETNFFKIDDVFYELYNLSVKEDECYKSLENRHGLNGRVASMVLGREEVQALKERFDDEIVISVFRALANNMAEESGGVSLIAYYDLDPALGLVQFRMRRSHSYKDFDLRTVMDIFGITNGGGHEGAIGFRLPEELVPDPARYVAEMIERLNRELG